MITLARFVIRPTDDGRGDLILGALFKQQRPDLLRPGLVYEIREVMDTMVLTSVGDAAIGRNTKDSLMPHIHWLGTPDQILTSGGAHLLTREEYARR